MEWEKYLSQNRLRESTRNMGEDNRNEFESDYGRVIFSPATRRMHDKTQVMPLTHDDNIHTRLTHSLEVMSVAYSIGVRLAENKKFQKISNLKCEQLIRKIPLILQCASLVHDVGNPPFGHLGETSIKDYFVSYFDEERNKDGFKKAEIEDFREFDGNAQGFRILTKLQILDDLYGLNLTNATLGAYLKYPNAGSIDKDKLCKKKRGVFQSEQKYLEQIAEDTGMMKQATIIRHPLSFLVEAADNICYRAMDIEDGFNKKWFSFDELVSTLKNSEIYDKLPEIKENQKSSASKIIEFRLLVISTLITNCTNKFIENIDAICNGTYNNELIDDSCELNKKLENVCKKYLFRQREVVSMELQGDAVIKGLLSKYIEFLIQKPSTYLSRALPLISKSIIKTAFLENEIPYNESDYIESFKRLNEYSKLRVIVDYISGMTDQYALTQFRILHGQKAKRN